MKTKESEETVCAFLTMITQKKRLKNFWIDKETEFAGEFKKLCNAGRIQNYSTISKSKAAFAERTMRSLKKNFTSIWKRMDTSTLTNWLNSLKD